MAFSSHKHVFGNVCEAFESLNQLSFQCVQSLFQVGFYCLFVWRFLLGFFVCLFLFYQQYFIQGWETEIVVLIQKEVFALCGAALLHFSFIQKIAKHHIVKHKSFNIFYSLSGFSLPVAEQSLVWLDTNSLSSYLIYVSEINQALYIIEIYTNHN